MKIVIDLKLIARNAKIANYTMLATMGILALGMYLSFKYPNDTKMLTWMMAALCVGIMLSMVSNHYQTRFGRKPRPDELISSSLKGMGDKYTLYHYTTPVSHLLIGPAGIWGIIPYTINGTIVYEKNRWKQKGGSFFSKFFGGESIGRPDLEAEALKKDMTRALSSAFPGETVPEIHVAFVFVHRDVKVNVQDAPIPTMLVEKLKDYLKKNKQIKQLEPAEYEKYADYFTDRAESKMK